MNKIAALVVAGVSLFVVACSGGGEIERTAAAASGLTVAEACSGQVQCTIRGETTIMSLSKDANGCHLGGFTLAHDGTAVGEDQCGLTWWSTGWTLSVCDEDDKAYCFVECYPVEPSGVAN